MKKLTYIALCSICLVACAKPQKPTETLVAAPFSADSAYRFIAEQMAFGPRVPGTPAHKECCRYLQKQLHRFGAEVEQQTGVMTNYAGEEQTVVNIIGHYNIYTKRRILLCAHWDCRPWSDQEEDDNDRMSPVPGANDGASGVGVLLEIARQLGSREQTDNEDLGVDIVFFDVEDMGIPDFYTGPQRENTWCLGSQMWSQREVHKTKAKYRYGILLDMVGAPDASFPREYFSEKYASPWVDKVWNTASALGYGRYFTSKASYPITDDHFYVNRIAGIPCIDIIHYMPDTPTGFPAYWHTNNDDMSNISLTTLDAVGKTVITAILN